MTFSRLGRFLALAALPLFPAWATGTPVPILAYHNFSPDKPALFTVTTANLTQQLDWLAAHHVQVVPLAALNAQLRGGAPVQGPAVVITDDDGKETVYQYLYPEILRRHIPITVFIYPSVIGRTSYAMTWQQLDEMRRSGLVDIESHTYWHPNFKAERKKQSPDDFAKFLAKQLTLSKSVLEEKLGLQITSIAWPYGIHDAQIEQAAAQAGYQEAYSFGGGVARDGVDLYAIPRIPIAGSVGINQFARAVTSHLEDNGSATSDSLTSGFNQ